MIDSETGEPVEREERVRGYQLAKHDYLMIEDEEIDAVEIESSHTIEIERFVPRGEIDAIFLENSHYLAPDGKVAEEAFAVIREAMAEEDVVGIGRAVLARRERLLVLQPRGKGILATVLHYNYEVRDDRAYFEDIAEIKIPGEMLDLAKHIIRSKMGHFNIAEFEDRYENALIEMIRAKQAGRPVVAQKPPQPGKVINLMEALRKSIAAEQSAGPQADKVKERARAAASSRREPKRAAPKATKQSGQSAKPAAKKPAARK
jgi:DNA end-binding protein Ku